MFIMIVMCIICKTFDKYEKSVNKEDFLLLAGLYSGHQVQIFCFPFGFDLRVTLHDKIHFLYF